MFRYLFIRPLILQKIFRYENDNQKNDKDEHWQSQTYTERNKDVKNKKKLHENLLIHSDFHLCRYIYFHYRTKNYNEMGESGMTEIWINMCLVFVFNANEIIIVAFLKCVFWNFKIDIDRGIANDFWSNRSISTNTQYKSKFNICFTYLISLDDDNDDDLISKNKCCMHWVAKEIK